MVDYPGRICATIFIRGCNLRCPFCYNASLVLPERYNSEIAEDDVLLFLKKRKGMLDAVCVSGGEPLLDKGTPELLSRIKSLGYSVKVDTNGTFPDELNKIITDGAVDYVAMDIKNSKRKYAETVGVKNFDLSPVQKSINILKTQKIPYEFRTTISRRLHTAEDIDDIGKWLDGSPRYYIQLYSPDGNHVSDDMGIYTKSEGETFLDRVKLHFGEVGLRGA